MEKDCIIYEYAGFKYEIVDGKFGPVANPVPGQHPAANKDKHRQAAVQCWKSDNRNKGANSGSLRK